MSTDRLSTEYHKFGAQYYVAARASTHAQLLPVPGNLFHHAIELLLKGHLCATLTPAELKKIGHDLERLWKAFTDGFPAEDLAGHLPTIRSLQAFETIRYPDEILAQGMYATISIRPFVPHFDAHGGYEPPGYHIVLHDIDRLVHAIFRLSSLNSKFFFGILGEEARTYLLRDNPAFAITDIV